MRRSRAGWRTALVVVASLSTLAATACGGDGGLGPAPPPKAAEPAGSVQRLLSAGQRVGFARTYTARGTGFVHRGEYELAVRDFDSAIGLVDDAHRLYTNRALVQVLLGRDEEARADLAAAVSLGGRPALTLNGIRAYSCDNPTSRHEEAFRLYALGHYTAVRITGLRFCPQLPDPPAHQSPLPVSRTGLPADP